MLNPEDLPDYVRPELKEVAPARARSEAMSGGTDDVHAAGMAILPKWDGEDHLAYARRAKLTEVADFYGRTLEASVGMLFSGDLTYSAPLPPALAHLETDADGQGQPLHALLRDVAEDYLEAGWAGVAVEFPRVADPSALTVRDVQVQALRPYLVPLCADQLRSWQWGRRGASAYLTQFVLAEDVEVPAGAFGVTCETRYRVYRHDLTTNVVSVEVLKVQEDTCGDKKLIVVEPEAQIVGPDRIPVVWLGEFDSEPPLDRLAWLNVGHYRVSSDHRYLMSVCHAPTLVIEEADPNDTAPISIGVNTVMRLSGTQKARWMQADPDALAASERTMERQQAQMAALGMAFLARDKSARNETATGRTMDASADRASLSSVADSLGRMMTNALVLAAGYVGRPTTPEVTITPDYDPGRLDAQTITALSTLATAGQISVATLLQMLKDGDVLPDSVDVATEQQAAADEAAMRTLNVPDVTGVAA